MSLKTVFLLVCSIVAINSFTAPFDDRKLRSDRSLYPLTGYEVRPREHNDYRSSEEGQFGQSYTRNEEGSTFDGQTGSSNLNQGWYGGKRPEGQKLKIQYPSPSSSSSSQENSNESHEIKKVEKQYHDNDGYQGGNSHYQPGQAQPRNYKVMNFEAPDIQNAIDKDM